MGIMKMWEDASRKLYSVFGSKLQGQYDEIKKWNCPELTSICKTLDNILAPSIKATALNFIIGIYNQYGEEYAIRISNTIFKMFK